MTPRAMSMGLSSACYASARGNGRRLALVPIIASDKSDVESRWMRDARRQPGLIGQLTPALKVVHRWGWRGLG